MRNRTHVSLFPFLSVLVSTMGVLSLLAVTFSMFAGPDSKLGPEAPKRAARMVDVRWVGAPPQVRPLLVECRSDGALVRLEQGKPPQFYSTLMLQQEVRTVRAMEEQGIRQMGLGISRQTLWLYFKSSIDREPRLKGTLTQAMHQLELSNLNGPNHEKREEHYPIFLVYPNGIESYDLVSYLVETTSHLATGVEPMLAGWALPDYGSATRRGRGTGTGAMP